PPPPMGPQGSPPPPAPQSQTVQTLQASEREDSGRNFELIYAKGEAGGSYVNMTSFSQSQLALTPTQSAGGTFAVPAGVRLLSFTIGARARMNALADWTLWQIDGEVGLHVPIGRLDPYFALYGGYAFTGALATGLADQATVHGFDAGLSLGGDYYFTSLLSL